MVKQVMNSTVLCNSWLVLPF